MTPELIAWDDMTSSEVAEALGTTKVVLIPLGAIEQHGGHIPLNWDTHQAAEFARRAVKALAAEGKRALIGPSIPFGPVADMRFSGTVNVKPSTLIALTKDVCHSLYHHGARSIVLILGHDESYGALMVAAQELVEETNDALKVIVANWLPSQKELEASLLKIPDGKKDTHGGAGETARLLWQFPERVRRDRFNDYVQDATPSRVPYSHALVLGGGIYFPRKEIIKDPSYTGIVGFPGIATAEAGDQLYEAGGKWLAEIIKEHCYS